MRWFEMDNRRKAVEMHSFIILCTFHSMFVPSEIGGKL
jgi:hypothetical protein